MIGGWKSRKCLRVHLSWWRPPFLSLAQSGQQEKVHLKCKIHLFCLSWKWISVFYTPSTHLSNAYKTLSPFYLSHIVKVYLRRFLESIPCFICGFHFGNRRFGCTIWNIGTFWRGTSQIWRCIERQRDSLFSGRTLWQ